MRRGSYRGLFTPPVRKAQKLAGTVSSGFLLLLPY